ncbi:MAG: hypothetical protein KA715_08715 [Xanthomonadaceae bacterium]|nr:hypothetical protein [Xanthomonadaceae bacterium]
MKLKVATALILGTVLSRLIPHPPNFAPVTAMAVFAGFYFSNIWLALFIPLVTMVLSDAVMGFHADILLVYGCFAITTWVSFALRGKKSVVRVASIVMASNLFFFLVTNFAAWPGNPLYAQDISGLFQSYTAAIPFYGNSLVGDAFYCVALFGTWEMLSRSIPDLKITA